MPHDNSDTSESESMAEYPQVQSQHRKTRSPQTEIVLPEVPGFPSFIIDSPGNYCMSIITPQCKYVIKQNSTVLGKEKDNCKIIKALHH